MSDAMLVAENRTLAGKADARRIRRAGKVPCIIYGEGEPTSVTVDAHELTMMMKGNRSVISLQVDGKEKQTIVREIQYHPVKGNIIHVDFMGVKKGHLVTMSVPIVFEGEPVGVKIGGLFDEIKQILNISVLPKNIPDEVKVDISGLDMGDSLRVKDVQLDNVEFLDDPEDVLCRVAIPRGTDEDEAGEEGEDDEMAEPEVLTARDKDEE